MVGDDAELTEGYCKDSLVWYLVLLFAVWHLDRLYYLFSLENTYAGGTL